MMDFGENLLQGAVYLLPEVLNAENGTTKELSTSSAKPIDKLERQMIYIGKHPFRHGQLHLFRSKNGGYIESFTPLQLGEHVAVRVYEKSKKKLRRVA